MVSKRERRVHGWTDGSDTREALPKELKALVDIVVVAPKGPNRNYVVAKIEESLAKNIQERGRRLDYDSGLPASQRSFSPKGVPFVVFCVQMKANRPLHSFC